MFIFDIDFTILAIGGQNLSLIELLSTISGLCCVFLATRGKVANFFITAPIPSIDFIPYAYTSPTVARVFLGGKELA